MGTSPANLYREYRRSAIVAWLPVLKIGFWNAWILALFVILHPLVMKFADSLFGAGDINIKMGETREVQGEKKPVPVPSLLLAALFILSVFIPLHLHTFWFYSGLVIYFLGIAIFLSSIITAAKTPTGQVFRGGMYRYSRHPLYLSFVIIFLGISLSTVSWIFLLLSMLWMVFPLSQVNAEELGCLESFGIRYQEYQQKTPRWLGIPKRY